MRLHDDSKIQEIIDELNSGERDDVAWAKALKRAKGNTAYAQALYIDERIKRLADLQHVIATEQKEIRLKYLEGKIREIDKVETNHSRILVLVLILCFPFAVVLFWEGDVKLGAAVVLVIFCCGIFSAVKLSRLDKQRKEISLQLDALLPPAKRSSWLGPLFVLAVVSLALGYLLT